MSQQKCVCKTEYVDNSTPTYLFHSLVKTTPDSGCEYCDQLAISTKEHNDRADKFIEKLKNSCCVKYPECKCSDKIHGFHQKMHELRLQEIAHEKGETCAEDDCQECCDHEFEDYTCLNCGAETDGSDECNRAHEILEGDR